MKNIKFIYLPLILVLASCGRTGGSTTSETPSMGDSEPISSPSSSPIVTDEVPVGLKGKSKENLVDYLMEAGKRCDYTVTIHSFAGDSDTIVNPSYYAIDSLESGYVLLDSYDAEETESEKLIYRYAVNEGEVEILSSLMTTSYYTTSNSYNILGDLIGTGGTLYSGYALGNLSYDSAEDVYVTNSYYYESLFADLLGASDYENYIDHVEISIPDSLDSVYVSIYQATETVDLLLASGTIHNVGISKSEYHDKLIDLVLPTEAISEEALSAYFGNSFSLKSEFAVRNHSTGVSTISSGVTLSKDDTHYRAVFTDEDGEISSAYQYEKRSDGGTDYCLINGNNEIIRSEVSGDDGGIYAFEEYAYRPMDHIDVKNVRKINEDTYRYFGTKQNDIFMSLTFNSASSYYYVDCIDFVVKDGKVDSVEFLFTDLVISNVYVDFVVTTVAQAEVGDLTLAPCKNENPELATAIASLKTSSFKATATFSYTYSSTVTRTYANYVYNATDKTLLVEHYEYNSTSSSTELITRKGYKQEGTILHYFDLSLDEVSNNSYKVLQEGYKEGEDISDYIGYSFSSEVFEKQADGTYASADFCNPTDAIDFGEALTTTYPEVTLTMGNDGKIDHIDARYLYSSTLAIYATDTVSFSYDNIPTLTFAK